MIVQTLADITPNGTATPLGATTIEAWWIAITASGSSIRVGDANVGAARGVAVPTGTTLFLPRISYDQQGYTLSQVYVYAGSGSDKVSVTYGA